MGRGSLRGGGMGRDEECGDGGKKGLHCPGGWLEIILRRITRRLGGVVGCCWKAGDPGAAGDPAGALTIAEGREPAPLAWGLGDCGICCGWALGSA